MAGKTRGSHKEGCQCAICKGQRAKAAKKADITPAEIVSTPIAPVECELGSLLTAALFELNGERYRIGEKTPECVVCYRLRFFDTGPLEIDKMWRVDKTVSLATFTMVKPIK